MLFPLLLAAAAVPQVGAPTLSVAYVGDVDSPRAAAFVEFLEDRFGHVRALNREGLEPVEAARADVVLLDWDQQAGVMKWFDDRSLVLEHPLGPRERWRTPTVLLGSAGLNTAAAWDVRGGSG